ncbi:uncharacterized protein B0T15DRAFT_118318 [Chaetomium strumarium]|uniref:Uncharacterized protein n=1 Tax=Chaetomium strumarium TaxID=1170767 RepID=A0AAJ0M4I1_9PEZI|nr:hypothetical protein B0T15DRAFT_118318 [Chaetomium strumarium]
MPSKDRGYYLTTSPSKDFTWFLFGTSATARTAKSKAQVPSPYRVSKARRPVMVSAKEEQKSGRALVPAVDVKGVSPTPRTRTKSSKPKRSGPKKGGSGSTGPWSEWYVSEDSRYLWRARKSRDEAWDYEFTHHHQKPGQFQDTTPTTCSGEACRPLYPPPEMPPPSPNPSKSHDRTSPKSSWPTIATTSTGQPTEFLSASSSRTMTTLLRETDSNNMIGTTSTTLVPVAVATQPGLHRGNVKSKGSSGKRPVGPVMRLLQEARSRKSKTNSDAVQSSVDDTAQLLKTNDLDDGRPQKLSWEGRNGRDSTNYGGDGDAIPGNKRTKAFARKLHAKVKSEKELKVDPKRRVKAWLKDVELDMTPIRLDAQGFPIYR